ncbi:MAG TPA: NUDIX domain-containing protein [Pyrinomonadaceae bacterium]|nr:NUDIX domain-containing protein [Pyrinomonadaceae bacterium]
MDFEPQKFFVGLIDFFSILLPGALLTFLLKGELQQSAWVAQRLPELDGAKGWAAFVVASYVLGHLAFLLGSWLDEFYDWLRRRTQNNQIKQLARRGRPVHWWIRLLVWLVFKRETDVAVQRAGTIKALYLSPLRAKKAINHFQWCKAVLTTESPTSLATVQRFEADSKFFRCFAIVLLVLVALALLNHHRGWAIAGAALLPLTLWRFMDQRYKATNHAYWSVITLAGQKGQIKIEKTARANSDLTHAGGVVFRKPWFRQARYLLVESSGGSIEWVLPKGKIEDGEDLRETAVREVHEESGVWARICCDLGRLSYSVNGKEIRTQIFLMEQAARGFRNEYTRKNKWLTLEQAKQRATHLATRELLDLAEKHRLRK